MTNSLWPKASAQVNLPFATLSVVLINSSPASDKFISLERIFETSQSICSPMPFTANPLTVKGMGEHIDCDVSKILSREMNLSEAGDELIKTTLRVANGRLTCAEALGHREFVMTKLYRSA